MRDIKFRGNNGKIWIYGDLMQLSWGAAIISEIGGIPIQVIEDSVGQYTGLKDKNGNDIYEGDVVKVGIFTYQVIFSDGCFDVIGIQNDKRDYLKCIVVNHVGIVIGNIYENPDLLKR